jgi:hypothetical protein
MSKNLEVFTGKLVVMERLKSSVNGNPRYSFVIVDSEGNLSPLIKTKPDSSYGYSITNYQDKMVSVEVGMYHNNLSLFDINK